MFEGLNAIAWSDLTHAYGSAKEVPRWLRHLASHDEHARSEAIEHLHAAICHQGWICPATGYAVPYLVELLQRPTIPGKAGILSLLVEIAGAAPLDEETWRTNLAVPEWEVPAHIPFKDAQEAVGMGFPVYGALLDAPALDVRMWAARLLVQFPDHAQRLWLRLQASFEREGAEQGRANLALALGDLALSLPEKQGFFLEQFQAEQSPLVTFAVALALTRLAQAETPEAVVQRLVQVMRQDPPALEAYRVLPCAGSPARVAARWTLFYLGSQRLQFLVPWLRERLAQAQSGETSRESLDTQGYAELMIFIVFGDKPTTSRKPRQPATLSEEQRSILLLLVKLEQVWLSSHVQDLLVGHRLPDTREKMVAYLGHS
jgi:hypothetical protein